MKNKIHPLSDIQSSDVGNSTSIWQYTVILPKAKIGENCNICSHVFIENEVIVGNDVTIKNGVRIFDGASIQDNVFIGPNVIFTNDKYPRSKKEYKLHRINIGKGAAVGAGSILVGPVNIGEFAMMGAGSVVTKDIPSYSLAVGNPAKIVGSVNDKGTKIS